MLEVIIVFLGFFLFYFVDNFYFSVFLLTALVILVVPGIYALLFGAPFLPSRKKNIEIMLNFANLKKSDIVYELGCGDGRVIREIADRGVKRACGLEYSCPTYLLARFLKFLHKSKEELVFRNFWKEDFSEADVVVCFLFKPIMGRVKTDIWNNLKSGCRLVSNAFPLPGLVAEECENNVYLYVKK